MTATARKIPRVRRAEVQAEATALREGPVRQALAAVQRLDAGLAVKQRRLRAVGA